MAEYKISVDLSGLMDSLVSPIDAVVLPTINQAVRAVAAETAYRWKDAVSKAKLWYGEKIPYQQSINWRMTGDFSAIVETDYKLAEEIETGRPAKDLKVMLNTSLKVRVAQGGKNAGKRYLIIPFRHNTPGMNAHAPDMPAHIYNEAKNLKASRVLQTGSRQSGTGAISLKNKKAITVPQRKYKWGQSLPAGLAPKKSAHHTTDVYAGMVRFKTSAFGGKRSSAYMTFRIMMEGSPKWIVQAKPGLYLAQKVRDEIAAVAPQVFAQAIAHLK